MNDWSDNGAMFALAALGAMAVGAEVVRWTGVAGSRALTQGERDVLPSSAFAIPSKRTYPMPDLEYGRRALTYSMWPNNAPDRANVKRAVFARYPSLVGWWNNTDWVASHPAEAVSARQRRVA